MDINAYDDFISLIDKMNDEKMFFLYEKDKDKAIQEVKRALNEAKELGNFGERRIALENLLDNLSEVGLLLSSKAISLAEQAFGIKNKNEQLLLDYLYNNLVNDNI